MISSFHTLLISFSVLNVKEMLHSPYGQFAYCIFRGKESRENLERHMKQFHAEIKELLKDGGEFVLPSGEEEAFNVVPFLCADLSFLKDVLGRCSCIRRYGCIYCKLSIDNWGNEKFEKGDSMTMHQMCVYGKKGRDILGDNPDHNTPNFTQFQQSHYGQYTLLL